MSEPSHAQFAILTGDLIGSRSLAASDLADTLEAMKRFWRKFADHHPGGVVGGLEVFRGDGWQVALTSPELCVEAAVFLRAVVKACPASGKSDSRVGIGVGDVEHLNAGRLGESQGAAFLASGDALERVSGTKIGWKLISGNERAQTVDDLLLPALDVAVSRWTEAESVAVTGEILGWSQEQTAGHEWALKKDGTAPSQQAVADALRRIQWKTHIRLALQNASVFLGDLNRTSSEAANMQNKLKSLYSVDTSI